MKNNDFVRDGMRASVGLHHVGAVQSLRTIERDTGRTSHLTAAICIEETDFLPSKLHQSHAVARPFAQINVESGDRNNHHLLYRPKRWAKLLDGDNIRHLYHHLVAAVVGVRFARGSKKCSNGDPGNQAVHVASSDSNSGPDNAVEFRESNRPEVDYFTPFGARVEPQKIIRIDSKRSRLPYWAVAAFCCFAWAGAILSLANFGVHSYFTLKSLDQQIAWDARR